MLKNCYAVWNNKGGVGKSTLTFHLASRYADLTPTEKVLIVDMCPQANSTMMFFGSGVKGEKQVVDLENMSPAPTVAGYISDQINRLTNNGKTQPASTWLHHVITVNSKLPNNLYIIPGDANLELLAAPVAYYANAQFPQGIWAAVHLWIKELIDVLTDGSDVWTVFIDTNPSFSIYTELAISAADKLLVPFNADDSSRHAVAANVRLLHGVGAANSVYDSYTYRSRAQQASMKIPQYHLFIGNRFTQYKGSAKAFSALSDAVSTELYAIYKQSPDCFAKRRKKARTQAEFLKEYSRDVRDFNTTGVVAAHRGELISQLKDGEYDVHGESVSVRRNNIVDCTNAIDDIVKLL